MSFWKRKSETTFADLPCTATIVAVRELPRSEYESFRSWEVDVQEGEQGSIRVLSFYAYRPTLEDIRSRWLSILATERADREFAALVGKRITSC